MKEIIITASDLRATENFWCDKCAVGRAVYRQTGVRPTSVSLESMYIDRAILKFDRYTENKFKRDRNKAKGARGNKIIRKLQIL